MAGYARAITLVPYPAFMKGKESTDQLFCEPNEEFSAPVMIQAWQEQRFLGDFSVTNVLLKMQHPSRNDNVRKSRSSLWVQNAEYLLNRLRRHVETDHLLLQLGEADLPTHVSVQPGSQS